MPRLRKTRSSKRRPRPPSPFSIGTGIPGDYFECNEQQLVQKLDTLRRGSNGNPFVIPSLLGHSESMDSASLNTTEDDPDLFFKEWEEEEHLDLDLAAKMHVVVSAENDDDAGQEVVYSDINYYGSISNHGDVMERLDGEQLSVHSPDDGSLAEERNDYQQQFDQKQTSKSKSERGLLQRIGLGPSPSPKNNNTNKSSKSWEGSEIVLDANSFIIDPSLLEKVQQEINFGKGVSSLNAGSGIGAGIGISSFHLVGSGSKKGTLEERSDASPRTITKLIFDQESESESSPLSPSKSKSLSLSKKKKHVAVMPATSFSSSLNKYNSTDSDQKNLHDDRARGTTTTKPLHAPSQSIPQSRPHPQTAFARRWSFSSSVADEEEEQDEIHPNSLPYFAKSKSFSHQRKHHRHRPASAASSASATTRSSNPDYTSLDANQELFLKLSEDDDLRDFKHINNFSFEGDYLLSRILRERMRIQLKRDMLTTPDYKDLYVETHKRVSRSEMEVADDLRSERSVYFMI